MILVDFWVAQTYLTFEVIQATRDDRAIEVMLGNGQCSTILGQDITQHAPKYYSSRAVWDKFWDYPEMNWVLKIPSGKLT